MDGSQDTKCAVGFLSSIKQDHKSTRSKGTGARMAAPRSVGEALNFHKHSMFGYSTGMQVCPAMQTGVCSWQGSWQVPFCRILPKLDSRI